MATRLEDMVSSDLTKNSDSTSTLENKKDAELEKLSATKKRYPKAHLSFETEGENELRVTIETERLQLESISDRHTKEYLELFADPAVVAKFGDGKPKDPTTFKDRVTNWVGRWKSNNPFSALAVSLKKSELPSTGISPGTSLGANSTNASLSTSAEFQAFIGHVILGGADPAVVKIEDQELNASELAYLFHTKSWGKGYGTEAVTAVVQDYALEMAKKEYRVNNNAFQAICATSRQDNTASRKILLFQGMKKIGETFKFGAQRDEFAISLESIKAAQKKA